MTSPWELAAVHLPPPRLVRPQTGDGNASPTVTVPGGGLALRTPPGTPLL
ncbi:hypothetical protein EV650_0483 [Kribbella kalugense]|uniref:Uncharacterized protein n=1 Tax=Kribbella kalugense TaxID=2512221 RepID=A0A4V3G859_9ACTN|nr:hypothetical protein EV650_0483 [Kribbella kalugense]